MINRDLNITKMNFTSEFGNSALHKWSFITWPSSKEGKFDFYFKFDIGDQGQLPNKNIKILTEVFYMSDPNLVIRG